MRRLVGLVSAVAVVGVVAVGVVACSDDSSESGSTETRSTAASSAPSATTVAPTAVAAALAGKCLEYTQAFTAGASRTAEDAAAARAAFVALENDVPPALQPDVRTFVAWFDALQSLYAEHDDDSAAIMADPRFAALFDDQTVIDANGRIGAWLQAECAAE